MSAEIVSLAAWRARRKGPRDRSSAEQGDDVEREVRDLRQRNVKAQERLDRLAERLRANVTRQGPNRGKPLTDGNRYQLENECRNLRRWMAKRDERIRELEKSARELRGGGE